MLVNPVTDSTEARPIARIHGEPLLEIPQDLYIPPDALEVFLETFQGPLDLLLYLIRKHNLDILDIPVAELTRQYMVYVEMMRIEQLELAAEYLLMTALLIEIKSRMLLPVNPKAETDDARDPRAELVRRLLEYERIKKAAERLGGLPQAERDFNVIQVWVDRQAAAALPAVNLDDLCNAWWTILGRATANHHHQIKREALSVRAYMSQVLRDLRDKTRIEFFQLFHPDATAAEVVVTLLAVLELVKEQLLTISQTQDSGIIYIHTVDTDLPRLAP
ncbi:MAG: segregation/condensation protein A [Nitrosomonas sp.]|nr:MAG: segregation/condensation protein A [Nitrosomonas sp.]